MLTNEPHAPGPDLDPTAVPRSYDDAGPLGPLAQLSRRQVRLENRLARLAPEGRPPTHRLGPDECFGPLEWQGRADVLWRPSGLGRPGLVAQLSWPRLATRLAIGVETPIAHALVDRLLGYTRPPTEARRQLTPVEWGVLTYLLARGLEQVADRPGALGPWDLVLDRVGPDPFDHHRLGSVVTVRWGVRVGAVEGSIRLWLPESLVALWLISIPPEPAGATAQGQAATPPRSAPLVGVWRAEAGTIELTRGLRTLRVGGVLPLGADSPLRGTPQSPAGPVELAIPLSDPPERLWWTTEPAAGSGGRLLTLRSPLQRAPVPREGLALNPSTTPNTNPGAESGSESAPLPPTDVPVTLTVELGRINLSLSRVADLKPGDVVELGRHSREPVELTSGGRLVARGELVLIDTELGVRITNVFL